MKPLFDVVLIGRNEEKTLPRLLASLEEFKAQGGHVFLTDTGSTDKTADVARAWGVNVMEVGDRFRRTISKEQAETINARFVKENETPLLKEGDTLFDFASARNFAASLASQDMIAMPDCDECFTTFDIAAINQAIEDEAQQLEYQFVYAHDAQGLPTVQFLHSKFYSRSKMTWKGAVHEILSGEAKRKYLPESVIKLEHFQNQATVRSGYLKGLAFAMLGEGAAESEDRASHYFAREMLYTGRPYSAIKEFERHIAMNKWEPERSQSAVFLGECYGMIHDEKKQLAAYHLAYDICGDRREPLIKLAQFYFRKCEPRRALAYCEAALSIPQGNFYADNAEDYRHVPHEIAAWAAFCLGDKRVAAAHFEEALKFAPFNSKILHDVRYHRNLPTVSFVIPTLGREEGLKKCLASVKALNYPQDKIDICVLDEPEPTVPQKVKEGVEKTKGDYICYAANDTEFTPDALIIAILASLNLKKGLVAFHSEALLPDEGNICAHFIIRRDLLPKIGNEIFDTEFTHVGVDNLLWAKCKKLNEAHHEFNAKITHNHFSTKRAEFDWIYERGWKNADKDRALLACKLALV